MKVAHHGYTTSSSSAFVKAFTPVIAWVPQCRMPSMDVYQKYKDSGSKVYVTGQDGILLFVSDRENITLVTEKDRDPNMVKP
jgi:beta-lactamase superfamily II metal-dependent hydrolase